MKHFKFENAAVVLAGANAAREYLEPIFSQRKQELMVIALCDDQVRLVQLLAFPGTEHAVRISFLEIFRRAIEFSSIILAHNHPSGDPRPSGADMAVTRRLCLVAQAIDVTVLDHLIFAGGRMFSFRRQGLL